jgi:G3E family GTPase
MASSIAQFERQRGSVDGAIAAKSEGFTYLARRPFDPLRFYCLLHSPWPAQIDARGCFWIATRPDWMGEIECVRGKVRYRACSVWWATLPRSDWPPLPVSRSTIERDWHPTFGDRRQQIVFTGSGIDPAAIQRVFDGCLVKGSDDLASWNPGWSSLPDPFESWGQLHPAWGRAKG